MIGVQDLQVLNERLAAAGITTQAAIESSYVAIAEEMGLYGIGADNSTLVSLLKYAGIEFDESSYVYNLKDYDVEGKIDDSRDSYYLVSYDNETSFVDEAFGYSDKSGGFNSVDTYIDPFDPEITKLLNSIPGLNDPNLSTEEKLVKLYNYIVNNFNYVVEETDDWNFISETIFARGGDCEDLSILLASAMIALLMQEGLDYQTANSRVSAVAGKLAVDGDHVFVEYLADDGQWYVLDAALAKEGNIKKLSDLQKVSDLDFQTYFRFNDYKVFSEQGSVNSVRDDMQAYIDPEQAYLQKILDQFETETDLENATMDELTMKLFNFLRSEFEYNSELPFMPDMELFLDMKTGVSQNLTLLMTNMLLAMASRLGLEIPKVRICEATNKKGEKEYIVIYEDESGIDRVFDFTDKITDPVLQISLLNSANDLFSITSYIPAEDLEMLVTYGEQYGLENNIYKRSVVRFNAQAGYVQDNLQSTYNPLDDEQSNTIKDFYNSEMDMIGRWSRTSAKQAQDAIKNMKGKDTNSVEESDFDQSTWYGKNQYLTQTAMAKLANVSAYIEDNNNFWSFNDLAFEKARADLMLQRAILSFMAMIMEAENESYNIVSAELEWQEDSYKSMKASSIIQAETDYLTKGANELKKEASGVVTQHNQLLESILSKEIDELERVKNTNLMYGGLIAAGVSVAVGIATMTGATVTKWLGSGLLAAVITSPIGAALLGGATALFPVLGKVIGYATSGLSLAQDENRAEKASWRADISSAKKYSAEKTFQSGLNSVQYLTEKGVTTHHSAYKNSMTGASAMNAISSNLIYQYDLLKTGAGEKFFQGAYGLIYENEESLLGIERELSRLQTMNRLLVSMHGLKTQSRNMVHQEMTSKAGYTNSSLAESMTEQEQQVIMEKFNEIKQLRAEYINSYNQHMKSRQNANKMVAKFVVNTAAFWVGVGTQFIPIVGPGPATIMALASTIWNMTEFKWDMDDVRPILGTHALLNASNYGGFAHNSDSWDFMGWLNDQMDTDNTVINFEPKATLRRPNISNGAAKVPNTNLAMPSEDARKQPDILQWASTINISEEHLKEFVNKYSSRYEIVDGKLQTKTHTVIYTEEEISQIEYFNYKDNNITIPSGATLKVDESGGETKYILSQVKQKEVCDVVMTNDEIAYLRELIVEEYTSNNNALNSFSLGEYTHSTYSEYSSGDGYGTKYDIYSYSRQTMTFDYVSDELRKTLTDLAKDTNRYEVLWNADQTKATLIYKGDIYTEQNGTYTNPQNKTKWLNEDQHEAEQAKIQSEINLIRTAMQKDTMATYDAAEELWHNSNFRYRVEAVDNKQDVLADKNKLENDYGYLVEDRTKVDDFLDKLFGGANSLVRDDRVFIYVTGLVSQDSYEIIRDGSKTYHVEGQDPVTATSDLRSGSRQAIINLYNSQYVKLADGKTVREKLTDDKDDKDPTKFYFAPKSVKIGSFGQLNIEYLNKTEDLNMYYDSFTGMLVYFGSGKLSDEQIKILRANAVYAQEKVGIEELIEKVNGPAPGEDPTNSSMNQVEQDMNNITNSSGDSISVPSSLKDGQSKVDISVTSGNETNFQMMYRAKIAMMRAKAMEVVNTQRSLYMVKRYELESRNLIHQEMTNTTTYQVSANAEAALAAEFGYISAVIAAYASREEHRVQMNNERFERKMQREKSFAMGLAGPLSFVVSDIYDALRDNSILKVDLNSVTNITAKGIGTEEAQKLNNIGEINGGTGVNVYDDKVDYFGKNTGYINIEEKTLFEADMGPLGDIKIGVGYAHVNYEVLEKSIKEIYSGTYLNAVLMSIYSAKLSSRSMVHQIMTNVSNLTMSSYDSSIINTENQFITAKAQDLSKNVQDMMALKQKQVDAQYQQGSNKVKAMVSGFATVLSIAIGVICLIAPTPDVGTFIDIINAVSSLINSMFDLFYAIVQKVLLGQLVNEAEKKDKEVMEKAKKAAESESANKDTEAEKYELGGGDPGFANVDSSSAAGAKFQLGIVQANMKKMERVKAAFRKIAQAQRESRSKVSAKISGIGGAQITNAAEMVAGLESGLAEALIGEMISMAQNRESLEKKEEAALESLISSITSAVNSTLSAVQTGVNIGKAGNIKQNKNKTFKDRLGGVMLAFAGFDTREGKDKDGNSIGDQRGEARKEASGFAFSGKGDDFQVTNEDGSVSIAGTFGAADENGVQTAKVGDTGYTISRDKDGKMTVSASNANGNDLGQIGTVDKNGKFKATVNEKDFGGAGSNSLGKMAGALGLAFGDSGLSGGARLAMFAGALLQAAMAFQSVMTGGWLNWGGYSKNGPGEGAVADRGKPTATPTEGIRVEEQLEKEESTAIPAPKPVITTSNETNTSGGTFEASKTAKGSMDGRIGGVVERNNTDFNIGSEVATSSVVNGNTTTDTTTTTTRKIEQITLNGFVNGGDKGELTDNFSYDTALGRALVQVTPEMIDALKNSGTPRSLAAANKLAPFANMSQEELENHILNMSIDEKNALIDEINNTGVVNINLQNLVGVGVNLKDLKNQNATVSETGYLIIDGVETRVRVENTEKSAAERRVSSASVSISTSTTTDTKTTTLASEKEPPQNPAPEAPKVPKPTGSFTGTDDTGKAVLFTPSTKNPGMFVVAGGDPEQEYKLDNGNMMMNAVNPQGMVQSTTALSGNGAFNGATVTAISDGQGGLTYSVTDAKGNEYAAERNDDGTFNVMNEDGEFAGTMQIDSSTGETTISKETSVDGSSLDTFNFVMQMLKYLTEAADAITKEIISSQEDKMDSTISDGLGAALAMMDPRDAQEIMSVIVNEAAGESSERITATSNMNEKIAQLVMGKGWDGNPNNMHGTLSAGIMNLGINAKFSSQNQALEREAAALFLAESIDPESVGLPAGSDKGFIAKMLLENKEYKELIESVVAIKKELLEQLGDGEEVTRVMDALYQKIANGTLEVKDGTIKDNGVPITQIEGVQIEITDKMLKAIDKIIDTVGADDPKGTMPDSKRSQFISAFQKNYNEIEAQAKDIATARLTKQKEAMSEIGEARKLFVDLGNGETEVTFYVDKNGIAYIPLKEDGTPYDDEELLIIAEAITAQATEEGKTEITDITVPLPGFDGKPTNGATFLITKGEDGKWTTSLNIPFGVDMKDEEISNVVKWLQGNQIEGSNINVATIEINTLNEKDEVVTTSTYTNNGKLTIQSTDSPSGKERQNQIFQANSWYRLTESATQARIDIQNLDNPKENAYGHYGTFESIVEAIGQGNIPGVSISPSPLVRNEKTGVFEIESITIDQRQIQNTHEDELYTLIQNSGTAKFTIIDDSGTRTVIDQQNMEVGNYREAMGAKSVNTDTLLNDIFSGQGSVSNADLSARREQLEARTEAYRMLNDSAMRKKILGYEATVNALNQNNAAQLASIENRTGVALDINSNTSFMEVYNAADKDLSKTIDVLDEWIDDTEIAINRGDFSQVDFLNHLHKMRADAARQSELPDRQTVLEMTESEVYADYAASKALLEARLAIEKEISLIEAGCEDPKLTAEAREAKLTELNAKLAFIENGGENLEEFISGKIRAEGTALNRLLIDRMNPGNKDNMLAIAQDIQTLLTQDIEVAFLDNQIKDCKADLEDVNRSLAELNERLAVLNRNVSENDHEIIQINQKIRHLNETVIPNLETEESELRAKLEAEIRKNSPSTINGIPNLTGLSPEKTILIDDAAIAKQVKEQMEAPSVFDKPHLIDASKQIKANTIALTALPRKNPEVLALAKAYANDSEFRARTMAMISFKTHIMGYSDIEETRMLRSALDVSGIHINNIIENMVQDAINSDDEQYSRAYFSKGGGEKGKNAVKDLLRIHDVKFQEAEFLYDLIQDISLQFNEAIDAISKTTNQARGEALISGSGLEDTGLTFNDRMGQLNNQWGKYTLVADFLSMTEGLSRDIAQNKLENKEDAGNLFSSALNRLSCSDYDSRMIRASYDKFMNSAISGEDFATARNEFKQALIDAGLLPLDPNSEEQKSFDEMFNDPNEARGAGATIDAGSTSAEDGSFASVQAHIESLLSDPEYLDKNGIDINDPNYENSSTFVELKQELLEDAMVIFTVKTVKLLSVERSFTNFYFKSDLAGSLNINSDIRDLNAASLQQWIIYGVVSKYFRVSDDVYKFNFNDVTANPVGGDNGLEDSNTINNADVPTEYDFTALGQQIPLSNLQWYALTSGLMEIYADSAKTPTEREEAIEKLLSSIQIDVTQDNPNGEGQEVVSKSLMDIPGLAQLLIGDSDLSKYQSAIHDSLVRTEDRPVVGNEGFRDMSIERQMANSCREILEDMGFDALRVIAEDQNWQDVHNSAQEERYRNMVGVRTTVAHYAGSALEAQENQLLDTFWVDHILSRSIVTKDTASVAVDAYINDRAFMEKINLKGELSSIVQGHLQGELQDIADIMNICRTDALEDTWDSELAKLYINQVSDSMEGTAYDRELGDIYNAQAIIARMSGSTATEAMTKLNALRATRITNLGRLFNEEKMIGQSAPDVTQSGDVTITANPISDPAYITWKSENHEQQFQDFLAEMIATKQILIQNNTGASDGFLSASANLPDITGTGFAENAPASIEISPEQLTTIEVPGEGIIQSEGRSIKITRGEDGKITSARITNSELLQKAGLDPENPLTKPEYEALLCEIEVEIKIEETPPVEPPKPIEIQPRVFSIPAMADVIEGEKMEDKTLSRNMLIDNARTGNVSATGLTDDQKNTWRNEIIPGIVDEINTLIGNGYSVEDIIINLDGYANGVGELHPNCVNIAYGRSTHVMEFVRKELTENRDSYEFNFDSDFNFNENSFTIGNYVGVKGDDWNGILQVAQGISDGGSFSYTSTSDEGIEITTNYNVRLINGEKQIFMLNDAKEPEDVKEAQVIRRVSVDENSNIVDINSSDFSWTGTNISFSQTAEASRYVFTDPVDTSKTITIEDNGIGISANGDRYRLESDDSGSRLSPLVTEAFLSEVRAGGFDEAIVQGLSGMTQAEAVDSLEQEESRILDREQIATKEWLSELVGNIEDEFIKGVLAEIEIESLTQQQVIDRINAENVGRQQRLAAAQNSGNQT